LLVCSFVDDTCQLLPYTGWAAAWGLYSASLAKVNNERRMLMRRLQVNGWTELLI
jgi:hypothetical protein